MTSSFFSIPASPDHGRSERASGARDVLLHFGISRLTDHEPCPLHLSRNRVQERIVTRSGHEK